mmetsp:Transcript_27107/g.57574  ORF Transcript_27107/g.57574 Transcript_27107/m.57574 type:complete len:219 (+) Transcript_27107:841-1497(+)
MTIFAIDATNICLRYPFMRPRIDSFSFTRSINSFTHVPCCVAIFRNSRSIPISSSVSVCRSSTVLIRKSISSVRNSISFRMLFTDARTPWPLAICNCLCATAGEFTTQIPPIKNTTALCAATIADVDAASPPTTSNDTAIVETTPFPRRPTIISSERDDIPSSSVSHPLTDERLSGYLDCLLGRSGSFNAADAAADAPAEYLAERRIPDAMSATNAAE